MKTVMKTVGRCGQRYAPAATVLARRKMASGISNVVFTYSCSHIYGSRATAESRESL